MARSVLALLLLCLAWAAHADVFRPAYLELREAGDDRYDAMWKVPAQGESRLTVEVRFPEGTMQVTRPQGLLSDIAYVERWQVSRKGGLTGQTLSIDGIAGGVTDVIVRVERQDGTSQVERAPRSGTRSARCRSWSSGSDSCTAARCTESGTPAEGRKIRHE